MTDSPYNASAMQLPDEARGGGGGGSFFWDMNAPMEDANKKRRGHQRVVEEHQVGMLHTTSKVWVGNGVSQNGKIC